MHWRSSGGNQHSVGTHERIYRNLWRRRDVRRVAEVDLGVVLTADERRMLGAPRAVPQRQNPSQQRGECHN